MGRTLSGRPSSPIAGRFKEDKTASTTANTAVIVVVSFLNSSDITVPVTSLNINAVTREATAGITNSTQTDRNTNHIKGANIQVDTTTIAASIICFEPASEDTLATFRERTTATFRFAETFFETLGIGQI